MFLLSRLFPPAARTTGAGVVLALFSVIYALVLIGNAHLGPSDEFHFLPTLQSGKALPIYGVSYFDTTKFGRFMPLAGQEYNVAALFSNSPTAYLALNAAQFLIVVFLLAKILRFYTDKRWLVTAVLLILAASPGFVHIFFTYLLTDKNVLFYYAIFLYSYLNFQRDGKFVYFFIALLSANAAIYYKETAFLAVGAFALVHLWFSWRQSTFRNRLLDGMLMLSGAIFIGLYLTLIYPNVTLDLYGGSNIAPGIRFLKNLFNFGFVTDPLLILVLFPLGGWRLYAVVLQKKAPAPVLDAMLIAAIVYVAAFLFLNMHGDYYLQPAYVFALPPMVWAMSRYLPYSRWAQYLSVIALVALSANTIPLGLHSITYYKYVPLNFNKAVDYLVDDIKHRDGALRANIFLYGVGPGVGNGHYYVFGEFLKFKGLPITRFDLKTASDGRGVLPPYIAQSPFDSKEELDLLNRGHQLRIPSIPYTVFQSDKKSPIQSGDYLVVSPLSEKHVGSEIIRSLQQDYRLVYQTHSSWAVPSLSLKALLKYALSVGLNDKTKSEGFLISENILNWPDFYVFIKK